MKIFIWILIFALVGQEALSKYIDAKNVVVAINCGSEDEYRDSTGVLYQEDKYFSAGVTSDYGAQFQWKGQDPTPLMTERYHSGDFHYSIPLRGDGKYVLILSFSEVYFNRPGQKVFNVDLGKQRVVTDLDIFDKVGQFTPYEEFIPFELKNGNIYINDRAVRDAYDRGQIVINFRQGKVDNPKINAIRIVRGILADTHYEDFKQALDYINKRKENKQPIRELENNQRREKEEVYEDEDVYESPDALTGAQSGEQSLVKTLLNIPYLLELSGVAFVLVFVMILKKLNAPSSKNKDE